MRIEERCFYVSRVLSYHNFSPSLHYYTNIKFYSANSLLRGESGYILRPNLSQIVKHIKLQLFYVCS